MTLFLLLVDLLAALVCVELIRGDMDGSTMLNFGQLWNPFLAVYQIFSSENWTNVLYAAADAEISLGRAVIVTVFLSSWLIFANCKWPAVLMRIALLRQHALFPPVIVMQMFTAVICHSRKLRRRRRNEEE
jgi:hypothetical protein